jgi:hypothetical protein
MANNIRHSAAIMNGGAPVKKIVMSGETSLGK